MKKLSGILLDIEGTTSSISFVHDVMFPFVLERLDDFLDSSFSRDDVHAACQQVAIDAGYDSLEAWQLKHPDSYPALVNAEVRRLMAGDVKATGLKALQGLIWASGFHSEQLKAHVYPDVIPAIESWRAAEIDVRIYSSGSIAAQKLFFGHVHGAGDCLHLFTGHFDTTSGGKKESASYAKIASEWGIPPHQILFISDIADEIAAAQQAGFQVMASVRPGNAPLPSAFPFPQITSFASVLG